MLAGEDNLEPGYAETGRLFASGYLIRAAGKCRRLIIILPYEAGDENRKGWVMGGQILLTSSYLGDHKAFTFG